MNSKLSNLSWLASFLLVISVLFNAFFVFQQLMIYQELEMLRNKAAALPPLAQIQSIAQNLMNELAGYGQRQPAIFGVLQKYGATPPPAPQPIPPPALAPPPHR